MEFHYSKDNFTILSMWLRIFYSLRKIILHNERILIVLIRLSVTMQILICAKLPKEKSFFDDQCSVFTAPQKVTLILISF